MCGIAGFWGEGDLGDLRRMTDAVAHRGPDAADHMLAPCGESAALHLGHRRLSLLDLEGGAQPMTSVSGRSVIVFNGEIYNHPELREELVREGFAFQTDHSDTETLLAAYEAYGLDMLSKVNGMFAFALFDKARQRLVLARDRFGQKPLYWTKRAGFFAFASELTSLLEHPCAPRSIGATAQMKLLAYGYCPSPATMIDGVYALEPGSWMAIDMPSLALSEGRYYAYRIAPDPALERCSVDEMAEEVGARLRTAVKRCLLSDVEVGALLSGGVDSSLVCAMAQTKLDRPLRAFSIGFEEDSFDESPHAAALANHIGAHLSVDVCTPEDMRRAISDVLPKLDEPFCDASILPTWMVCRAAARDVKTALTGDGADELFFGYEPFAALGMARVFYGATPRAGKRLARWCARRLPKSDGYMSLDFKLNRALSGASLREPFRAPAWLGPVDVDTLNQLFGVKLAPEEIYSEAFEHWRRSEAVAPAEQLSEFFARFYLAEGVLRKTDRASMLNSLELRAPFLDNDVADFAARMPSKFKMSGGVRKLVLRRLLEGLAPHALSQRKKQGFGVPIQSWLRNRALIPRESAFQIDRVRRQKLVDDHVGRRADWRYFLWTDLVLSEAPIVRRSLNAPPIAMAG